jgi:hypothetical protein
MKKIKFSNDRTECERCDRAIYCKKLRPCNDFAPAINSNFSAAVKLPEEAKSLCFEIAAELIY